LISIQYNYKKIDANAEEGSVDTLAAERGGVRNWRIGICSKLEATAKVQGDVLRDGANRSGGGHPSK